jgi:hypothetical protein
MTAPGRSGAVVGESGFSILEVLISLVILLTVLISVSSLMVTAFKVGANSRFRQAATEIATSTLDAEAETGAATLLGDVGDTALPATVSAGQTYRAELEVTPFQPGSSGCQSPQGTGNGETMLKVTVWVTWANEPSGATWWISSTSSATGLLVEETTQLAIPSTDLNAADGTILVTVDNASGTGVPSVAITASNSSTNTTLTATTTSSGCALFTNIAPGTWSITGYLAGDIDNDDDWSTSTNSAAILASGPVTVQAATTTTESWNYDNATVTPKYTVTLAGSSPWLPTNLGALPLTFYSSYFPSGVSSYVAASPALVYPYLSTTNPSYEVVPGSCGTESAPSGGNLSSATTDGQPLTVTSGATATVTFPLTPVDLVVDHGGIAVNGAQVSASVPASDTNCGSGTLAMPTLGLGTTCVPGVACALNVAYRTRHTPAAHHPGDATLVTICTSGCWTNTTLTASVSSATYGTPVTLTATVVCTSGTGCSNGNPTSGYETFTDGSVTLGTANVSSGTATLTTSSIPVGSPTTVSAIYTDTTGEWWGTETAGTKNLTVTAAGTTTALSSTPNPTTYGTSSLLTATITAASPSTATPTGRVNFTSAGTTITGCGAVTLSSGSATCTLTGSAGGTYSLTAVYTPSTSPTNFTTSTSSTLTESITAASTTTALTSSSSGGSVVGTSLTFTAAVTASSGGASVGTVLFKADGSAIAACPSAVAVSSGVATCTTSALAVGSHAMTAVFTPTTSTNFSGSSGSLTQDVYSASAPAIESGLPDGVWVISVTDTNVTDFRTVTLTITPQGISVNGGADVTPGTLIEVTD